MQPQPVCFLFLILFGRKPEKRMVEKKRLRVFITIMTTSTSFHPSKWSINLSTETRFHFPISRVFPYSLFSRQLISAIYVTKVEPFISRKTFPERVNSILFRSYLEVSIDLKITSCFFPFCILYSKDILRPSAILIRRVLAFFY